MEAINKQTANDNRSINHNLEWELDKWLHIREREPEYEALKTRKYIAIGGNRAVKLYLNQATIYTERGTQCDIEC